MQYRAVATSVEGFVQQIACCYLRYGYWFYVTGRVPVGKDPYAVDEKLIKKYGIAVSESTRTRRKQAGRANLQYLRHERFFVILANKGVHPFFDHEGHAIRDIRRLPLLYVGNSISYRRGTPGVCGGEPCIIRTRIPVWVLERGRQLGSSEAELLRAYPTLRAQDIVNAWAYVEMHREEIEQQIRENEEA